MTERNDEQHSASTPTQESATEHGHGEHGHAPHLAHHFDTPEQQFESSKLGMWVFLATEILMFGGLFAAYSVYRANNPEIYLYSHVYLDTTLGALNTVILLASSFTIAWGVRASQLGQTGLLKVMLILTLLGAGGFMVVKAIEYGDKFDHHLTPGPANVFYYPVENNPLFEDEEDPLQAQRAEIRELEEYYGVRPSSEAHAAEVAPVVLAQAPAEAAGQAEDADADADADAEDQEANGPILDRSQIPAAQRGPEGTASWLLEEDPAYGDQAHGLTYEELPTMAQRRTHMFFQIYYMMTGLHAIHVLIGMGLISWVLIRAWGGVFGPMYYTPVDLVGLYWHLVDLIWIFLFPLLYLIH